MKSSIILIINLESPDHRSSIIIIHKIIIHHRIIDHHPKLSNRATHTCKIWRRGGWAGGGNARFSVNPFILRRDAVKCIQRSFHVAMSPSRRLRQLEMTGLTRVFRVPFRVSLFARPASRVPCPVSRVPFPHVVSRIPCPAPRVGCLVSLVPCRSSRVPCPASGVRCTTPRAVSCMTRHLCWFAHRQMILAVSFSFFWFWRTPSMVAGIIGVHR